MQKNRIPGLRLNTLMKTDTIVSYSYISASDISFNEEWYNALKEECRNVSQGFIRDSQNPEHFLYPVRQWYTQEQMAKFTLTEIVTKCSYDENNNLIVHHRDELERNSAKIAGLIAPAAFDEIDKRIPNVGRFTLVTMINGTFPHFHAPMIYNNATKAIRDTRTVTVIIPINHSDPVTETVEFEYQEYTPEEEAAINLPTIKKYYTPYDKILDEANVFSLRLPSPGEWLVIDFNSSKCLHWVNPVNTNEYFCLMAEI